MPDMPDMDNMSPEQMKKLYEEMQRRENEGLSEEEIMKRNREREERKQKNLAQFAETSQILEKGSYEKDGQTVSLPLGDSELSKVQVFLPDAVQAMTVTPTKDAPCAVSCENKDALVLAGEKRKDPAYQDENGEGKILLLNMASAVRPGGGVRDGMGGQEEALCRNSTLLMSLESEAAKPFYDYNNNLHTHLGSDGVILSPNVVVFRDDKGDLLPAPFTISVITCAAPNVRFGTEGKSEDEYKDMLYQRIERLLTCAASLGYENLILGAFGCGAFRNDPALVSDDFRKVLDGPVGKAIAHADFAVLCSPGKEENYNEFCRNFS